MLILDLPRKLLKAGISSMHRIRLAQLGRGAEIQPQVRLHFPRKIKIGAASCVARSAILRANTDRSIGISLGERTHIGEFSILTANRGHVRIGNDSWIGSHNELQGNGLIEIGDDVMIGSHCVLNTVAHNCERADVPMRVQGLTCEPIHIEDDVWLGTGVTVLKGVRIGRGSIIGAGAVVTRDIPPYSIAVGVPARVTGQRSLEGKGELVELARYRAEVETCH